MKEFLCNGNPCDDAKQIANDYEQFSDDASTVVGDAFKILDGITGVQNRSAATIVESPDAVSSRMGRVIASRHRTLRILEAIDRSRDKTERILSTCRTCPGLGNCALASQLD
jgi:hypothetical protein